MNTIKNAFETVKETLSRAVSTSDLNSTVPLADIKALEETERAVRIEESTPALVAQNNAKLVSSFISSTNFPYFKGGLNKGFKNYTRRAEEMERARMLASKQELALKKNNAFLLSSQIKALGWPFMRDGPSVLLTDSFKLMEEEERDRRLGDKQWAMNSRNNAALVSNLVRWDNYQRHTTAGLKRITRNMEEKERHARVEDRAEQERAADLAFQTSGLIRRLGWPFYVQPSLDNKEMTREIEEEEKNRRLVNPHERLIAQENAGLVANLMHAKDTGFLSEKEKERRIEDALEQERHQAHAKRIASIIAKRYDPSELERQRLLADKEHTREAQLGAKKVAEIVPHFMSVSSWSINRAVEKERARKLNDITGTAFAKHNANKIANIVMDADLEKKTAWTNELEQERMRRMHDRVASDIAKKNARKVSKMVLRNNTSSLSLAEGERARRLGDLNEQSRHKLLAQKQAELIRQRSAVPIASTPAGYPAGLESALPSSSSSLPVGSATRSVPMFEQQAPLQQQAPLLQQQAPLFQQQAPMYTTGPTYIGQQPVLNNGMYASPLAAAPMLSSPSVYSTGPVYTSPSALPVTYSSPSVLPVTYRSPASVPVTFGAMPGTTYTTSTTYMPGTTPAYVPYDAGVASHLRVMTDKERKKMEKQATRHSRTSQREARKAEHDLSKAEKLHFKGRDDRAIKYESRAEQHNVAAKHHQAWAQELAADSLSHTLPSALPTVYRPAM